MTFRHARLVAHRSRFPPRASFIQRMGSQACMLVTLHAPTLRPVRGWTIVQRARPSDGDHTLRARHRPQACGPMSIVKTPPPIDKHPPPDRPAATRGVWRSFAYEATA